MYVSPLDLAREYNYTSLVHLLLERGAMDIDNTRARWDDLWADLQQAAIFKSQYVVALYSGFI
jgi:hypothetical protein